MMLIQLRLATVITRHTVVLGTTILLALATATYGAEQISSASWFERGTFRLGEATFDFDRGYASIGTQVAIPLDRMANCSDQTYQCLKAGVMNLIVPQKCSPWTTGDSWTSGGVSIKVVKVDDLAAPGYSPNGPAHVYTLVDTAPGHFNIIFYYIQDAQNRKGELIRILGGPLLFRENNDTAINLVTSGELKFSDYDKLGEEIKTLSNPAHAQAAPCKG